MVEGFGRLASQVGLWFNWGDEINWLGDECGVMVVAVRLRNRQEIFSTNLFASIR